MQFFKPNSQSVCGQRKAFVVYDRATGAIVHTHYAVTFAHNLHKGDARAEAMRHGEIALSRRQRRSTKPVPLNTPPVLLAILEVDPAQVAHYDSVFVEGDRIVLKRPAATTP